MCKAFFLRTKNIAALVCAALCFESLTIGPVEAAQSVPSGGSYLYTPCGPDTTQVRPVATRPLSPRKTLASPLPRRPRHRRKTAAHRPHRRPVTHRKALHKPVAHRPVVHRRAVAHRPRVVAARRPVLRKVTYASPLCYDRAPMIAALLGDVPAPLFQPLAVASVPVGSVTQPNVSVPPIVSILQPETVIPSPNTPGSPTVPGQPAGEDTPPVVVPVPEPASWAMIVAGFGFVGSGMRRRRRVRRAQAG